MPENVCHVYSATTHSTNEILKVIFMFLMKLNGLLLMLTGFGQIFNSTVLGLCVTNVCVQCLVVRI